MLELDVRVRLSKSGDREVPRGMVSVGHIQTKG